MKISSLFLIFKIVLLTVALTGCIDSGGDQASLPTLVATKTVVEPTVTKASPEPVASSTATAVIEQSVPTPIPLDPVHISLAPGTVSETIEGTVEPLTGASYSFNVLSGQELIVKVSSPDGLVNFELRGDADSHPYKDFSDPNQEWQGVTSQTQDYLLHLATSDAASPYLLTITILPPDEEPEQTEKVKESADGQWQILARLSDPQQVTEVELETFSTGQKYHVEMVVSRIDGSQSWTAVDEYRAWGLGYTYPDALRWSADGQYLYYTNVPVPDGCSTYVNGGDLWRLDLNSGETSQLLPFVGLVLALSPDDSQLAYFGSYGKGMTLADLETGIEQAIELPSFGAAWNLGGLTWSPDGRYLVLTEVVNPCMPGSETAVVAVDTDTQAASTLIEPGPENYTLLEWLDDSTIQIATPDGAKLVLNIISGALSSDTTGDMPQGN